MEQANSRLIALLEERLCNLKDLGQAVRECQQACLTADLEALRTLDLHKEHLCAEIRRVDQEICAHVANLGRSGSLRTILDATPSEGKGMDAATAQRLRDLFDESEAARANVAKINHVYAQFLSRSRGTLTVMINVFSHCQGVYPSNGSSLAASPSFERSY